jgi:hypothetical protein
MNNISGKRWIALSLAAALCGATSAMAVSENDPPPEISQGTVRYMTGGIGTEQQDAMKRAAASYPLELEFVERGDASELWRGMYTAGIGVTIVDNAGRIVLEARAGGPFMLASLPDGEYTVNADDGGRVVTRRVHFEHAKHQTVVFEWRA